MDVRLSPEQHALRDSVARVVADLAARAVAELDDEGRAAKLDAAVQAAGWRDLRSDDGTGAPLASGVEAAVVAEELGRGLADVAYLGPTLAADLRRRAGAPAAPEPETVALAAGLGALGGRGPAVALDAAGAARAVTLLTGGHGHALGLVEVGRATTQVDLTRTVVPLRPGAVRPLPDQRRALPPDDLTAVTALGLALASADLVGTMRGAVALATAYATERHQYGRPVGSFQAVQHLLADAHVATEGARSVALHAAWAVDALAPDDALAAAALAKAYCARAARTVCETAIQVHGGIGNTWECLAHVHLRRCLLSSEVLGGTGPSLDRVLAHHGLDRGTVGGGRRGLR